MELEKIQKKKMINDEYDDDSNSDQGVDDFSIVLDSSV